MRAGSLSRVRAAIGVGLAAGMLSSPGAALARDYGQLGAVFPIIEPDFLSVIEARLRNLQADGRIDDINRAFAKRAEARVRRPDPVEGLSATSKARSWLYDPSITLDHDVRDSKGNIVAHRGANVNPLDYIVVKTPLVFINGDEEGEVAWALKQPEASKIILVRGAPLELMGAHQRRFYFDQRGTLTHKFGIEHTPATVVQAGRAMRVAEVTVGGAS